jgi:RNA recognition motif-containing protein
MPGHHHYCFVDFSTVEEAERAANALNGTPFKGGNLRVSFTRSKWTDEGWKRADVGAEQAWKRADRPTDGSRESSQPATYRQRQRQQGEQQGEQDGRDRKERSDRQRAIMTASSWRRGPSAS